MKLNFQTQLFKKHILILFKSFDFYLYLILNKSEANRTCHQLPRSIPTPDAQCRFTQREQINQISSYIDGTTVYGVDESLVADIRDPESDAGELKMSQKYSGDLHGGTLPQTDEMIHHMGKPRNDFIFPIAKLSPTLSEWIREFL